jgi:cysteinyl-tRNA synthetase
LLRIDEWIRSLHEIAGNAAPDSKFAPAKSDKFFEALDDDLNISGALAEVFNQIRDTNRLINQGELTDGQAAALLNWWDRINGVLQLQEKTESIPDRVSSLLHNREKAREVRDWSQSDSLREEIEALGWLIKDTKQGPKLIKKSGQT